jgi:hypothetical protein
MSAALEFELLNARRAVVFRWRALVVAVGVPAPSTAFFELGGWKATPRPRPHGDDDHRPKPDQSSRHLARCGVAILITTGIIALCSLGSSSTTRCPRCSPSRPRSSVAAAKFVVLVGWAFLTFELRRDAK